jgi:hypothetical protein
VLQVCATVLPHNQLSFNDKRKRGLQGTRSPHFPSIAALVQMPGSPDVRKFVLERLNLGTASTGRHA